MEITLQFFEKKWVSGIVVMLLYCTTFTVMAQMPEKPKLTKVDHSETDWFIEVQKPTPNYTKVKTLYDAYFKTHPFERSQQRNLAIRWFVTNANNIDETGQVYSTIISPKETKVLMDLNRPRTTKSARTAMAMLSPYAAWNDMTGTWRMIGPYHGKDKECKNTPTMSGGFNDRVYINPYNTQNLFSKTC